MLMKLVAMLRIKDEILTIHETLSRLSELVDEIVIVDNGSTDGTLDVYKLFPKVVKVKSTKGFDEGRDKILAHKLARSRNPDWILWVDGDEVIEEFVTRDDLDKLMSSDKYNQILFRMYNFWDSKDTFRVDGKWKRYTSNPQRSMWRNSGNEYFDDLKFHNGNIRIKNPVRKVSEIRIKHFGFIDKEKTEKKYQQYAKLKKEVNSDKTMSKSRVGIQLKNWKPGRLQAKLDHLYWQYIYKYKNLIKTIIDYRLSKI